MVTVNKYLRNTSFSRFFQYRRWLIKFCFRFSRTVEPSVQNSQTAPAAARHVQSPAERRKDIVAQAMQEQKIFEENVPKVEPAVVKQEPGVSSTETTAATTTTSSTAADTKPQVTATKSTPTTTTTTTQRRPYQRSSNYNRQQVMPRLTVSF